MSLLLAAYEAGRNCYLRDRAAGKDPRRIPMPYLEDEERAQWFKGWDEAQRKANRW